jgi:hypothetical protein
MTGTFFCPQLKSFSLGFFQKVFMVVMKPLAEKRTKPP